MGQSGDRTGPIRRKIGTAAVDDAAGPRQPGLPKPVGLADMLRTDEAAIATASISQCRADAFPRLPFCLLAYDAKTTRILPERPMLSIGGFATGGHQSGASEEK